MEPFFSVLLSALFLNQPSSPAVLLTLLPIVGGVAMASVSEARCSLLSATLLAGMVIMSFQAILCLSSISQVLI